MGTERGGTLTSERLNVINEVKITVQVTNEKHGRGWTIVCDIFSLVIYRIFLCVV
jgi:hypothetical protein